MLRRRLFFTKNYFHLVCKLQRIVYSRLNKQGLRIDGVGQGINLKIKVLQNEEVRHGVNPKDFGTS